MKLFVTGGAGFIGSNFIRHMLGRAKSFSVVNYDALTYAGNLANLETVAADERYSFCKGDICDAALVESAMAGCDAVVHFAAESHVDRSIYDPGVTVRTNVTGTFTLLEAARKLKVPRFIQVSTDEVYGDVGPGTFADEKSVLAPNSPYAASKAAADLLVRSYVKTFNFPAIITRTSNNYGPYQFPEKLVPLLISNALEDKALPIYGDGKQERTWLHIDDHCRGLETVLERGKLGEIYNISGADVIDNIAMARRILQSCGRPESLIMHVADRPGHDRRYATTALKIEKELGWKPVVKLEDGLRGTIDWYRNNPKWLADVRGGGYRSYYQKNYENRAASLKSLTDAKPPAK
ncbi:MAG TPA: dTDP-glucose 4,6-dehydratase [Candidatus Acidoferrales bacterium]